MTMPSTRFRLLHYPLMALVVILLIAGLWAGLARMGWVLPATRADLIASHGPLMVAGVLSTLISLERVVAFVALRPARWKYIAYIGPVMTAIGAIVLAVGGPWAPAQFLFAAGSAVLVLLFTSVIYQLNAPYTIVMGVGAICLFFGNVMWMTGQPIYVAVHWWIAFLVLTVVGERLELARILHLSRKNQDTFIAAVLLFLLGTGITPFNLKAGIFLSGMGEVVLALWLFRYDIARMTIRKTGLPRFIAACLLAGYAWLAFSGALAMFIGEARAGLYYDALLHSLFIGYVFSLIFGHGPIILPALTGLSVTYHRSFYVFLVVLHGSLIMRVIGNLTGIVPLRQWGGMLNFISVLLFVVTMAVGRLLVRRQEARTAASMPNSRLESSSL